MSKLAPKNEEGKSMRATLLRRLAAQHEETARTYLELADLDEANLSVDEYSTYRLPADAKNADAFNHACREGLVQGARKSGRAWVCTHQAWRSRSQRSPSIARARAQAVVDDFDHETLEELGFMSAHRFEIIITDDRRVNVNAIDQKSKDWAERNAMMMRVVLYQLKEQNASKAICVKRIPASMLGASYYTAESLTLQFKELLKRAFPTETFEVLS